MGSRNCGHVMTRNKGTRGYVQYVTIHRVISKYVKRTIKEKGDCTKKADY